MLGSSKRSKISLNWVSESNSLSRISFLSDSLVPYSIIRLPGVVIVTRNLITRRARYRQWHHHRLITLKTTAVWIFLRRFLKSDDVFEATLWQCVIGSAIIALNCIANKRVKAGVRMFEVVADLAVHFKIVVTTWHLLWYQLQKKVVRVICVNLRK